MELGLIITGIAFIIMMSILYMDAHGDVKDYREEVRKQQKLIGRLNSDNEDLRFELSELKKDNTLKDTAATWAITHELIGDALKFNGYVIEEKVESGYVFKVDGDRYIIFYRKIPFLQLRITFSLNDEWNLELMKQAVALSNPNIFMAKASVDIEDRSFTAYIDIYEPTYGHLRDCLPSYLKAIDAARIDALEAYHKLLDESKQRQEDAALYRHVLTEKAAKSNNPS